MMSFTEEYNLKKKKRIIGSLKKLQEDNIKNE